MFVILFSLNYVEACSLVIPKIITISIDLLLALKYTVIFDFPPEAEPSIGLLTGIPIIVLQFFFK